MHSVNVTLNCQFTIRMRCFFRPLTEKQQESARNRRFMEIRLRLFLQELVSYMIFLMFLVFVVRGYRDNDEYYFSKSLRDDVVHGHFDKVSWVYFVLETIFHAMISKAQSIAAKCLRTLIRSIFSQYN